MKLTFLRRLFVMFLILGWSSLSTGAESAGPIALANDSAREDALFLLVTFVSLAIGISFLCSVAEAVLLSITPLYIEGLAAKKPKRAAVLKRLRVDKVDRSLAAILTMNTIGNTGGAMEAGAQSAIVFGSAWVGFFSAILTLLILFFSEIIPKTLGTVYWPKLTVITSFYIRVLIFCLYPLVLASEIVTKLITSENKVPKFSRDEFKAMAGLGEEIGAIDPHESKLILSLFRFRSLRVTDIMTPRTVIKALSQEATLAESRQAIVDSVFSRLPIYDGDLDNINGFILKDEVLSLRLRDHSEARLKEFRRDIHRVAETMLLPRLLESLINTRRHIVLVIDEYGGIKGLVTLEDVLETLLGAEILDETDDVVDMRHFARQQWIHRARRLGLEVKEDSPKH